MRYRFAGFTDMYKHGKRRRRCDPQQKDETDDRMDLHFEPVTRVYLNVYDVNTTAIALYKKAVCGLTESLIQKTRRVWCYHYLLKMRFI